MTACVEFVLLCVYLFDSSTSSATTPHLNTLTNGKERTAIPPEVLLFSFRSAVTHPG
jgi:hypothetical protein